MDTLKTIRRVTEWIAIPIIGLACFGLGMADAAIRYRRFGPLTGRAALTLGFVLTLSMIFVAGLAEFRLRQSSRPFLRRLAKLLLVLLNIGVAIVLIFAIAGLIGWIYVGMTGTDSHAFFGLPNAK